jgi:hypothetical protein
MYDKHRYNVSELTKSEQKSCNGGCDEDWSWAKRLGCAVGELFKASGDGFKRDPSAGWNVIR